MKNKNSSTKSVDIKMSRKTDQYTFENDMSLIDILLPSSSSSVYSFNISK